MKAPRPLRAALVAVPLALLTLLGASASGASAAGAPTGPSGATVRTMPADCAPVDISDEATVDQRAAASDDVFVGRVDAAAPVAGSTRVGYGVSVERVWLGDVAKGQQAAVTIEWPVGAAPGVRQGASYLFFTQDSPEGLVADACGGTVLLPRGLTPKIASTLRKFLESVAPPPAPTPTPEPVSFRAPEEPLGEPPQISRVVASGAAISLIGLLGLLLVSRLGRRG
ncbi:hypothetical protein ACJ5H2_20100 [Nocardioides sp. R1-1]|uniref:hypothetical protein n=1 Tax=Nocardioides sp. R1-1 TaxID=3383502 RepID=UPI0038D07AA1